MATFYDEVEIEDFEFDEEKQLFTYPCPCGDKFQITMDQISEGEEIARCPSCSLLVRVIYDPDDFGVEPDEDEGDMSSPALKRWKAQLVQ